MNRLEELKAVLAAATPGEWDYVVAESAETPSSFVVDEEGEHILRHRYGITRKAQHDVAVVALAHNLMPTLLEAATELARFIDYLDTASGDGAYEHEIQRALAILEKLK